MKRPKSAESKDAPNPKKLKKSTNPSTATQKPNNKQQADKKPQTNNKFNKKPKFEKSTATKKPFTQKSNKEAPKTAEKPDWKALKVEKKQLKEKRKIKRLDDAYDIAKTAKKLGEKLRQSKCSPTEREKIIKELFDLFSGHLKKFVFTHDMSRIIQWLIKFSTDEMKDSIVEELKSDLTQMWQSKYAVNCVKKLLKYGSKEVKNKVLAACFGKVVNIISHSVAAGVFNSAYNNSDWVSEQVKNQLKQEFYGDMYKNSKDNKVTCLTDVFKTATDMKSATLSALKMNLVRVLNKNVVDNALVQTVLCEYLENCSAEDRGELIVMLRDHIFELSQTKEGARAAMISIWHGTTKDRKASLKSMKDHIAEIAKSEHGHVILMAIFDSVDDTVLMKKILIPEIVASLEEIVCNEFGKKVVLYLVARRDTHHFHPQLIEALKEGDGNATSKKPQDIREKELLEVVIDPLLQAVAGNCEFWLANGSLAMVTLAILKKGRGEELKKAFQAIAEFLVKSEVKIKDGDVEYSCIEHPGLHMMLKKLIQADKEKLEKEEATFGEELVELLDDKVIKKWAEFNRACFVLVFLIENEGEAVVAKLKSKLSKVAGALKGKKTTGATILMKKIK
uniref:PUM-HD domain-containing protein n=1 Tax=Bracon brevicornis TaxID=1563983 RepID=A0A6V7LNR9_9HYME